MLAQPSGKCSYWRLPDSQLIVQDNRGAEIGQVVGAPPGHVAGAAGLFVSWCCPAKATASMREATPSLLRILQI
jgi:hypothetical protein